MNVESVYPKVKQILVDVLFIEEEQVALDKRLIADLGAESIDFLDLVFQLEKEFDIKIPRGQLEKNARGSLSEQEFEENGMVTERGMQALREYFTELPADQFPNTLKISEIPSLFTVETFCKVIIDAQQKAASQAV
ncbi:MAG: acyl carrier protein [Legionellales bacterium]|nr:acyl carrier protein [Legionellales bacterium]